MFGTHLDEMPIQGCDIVFLPGIHHINGRNQFHFIRCKALAYAVDLRTVSEPHGVVGHIWLPGLLLVKQGATTSFKLS